MIAVPGKLKAQDNLSHCKAVSRLLVKPKKITRLSEYKVKMVCADRLIKQVVVALLQAYPYQQPAYEVTKILSLNELPQ